MSHATEIMHRPSTELPIKDSVGILVHYSKLNGARLQIRGEVANGKPILPFSFDVLSATAREKHAVAAHEACVAKRDEQEQPIDYREFLDAFELIATGLQQRHDQVQEESEGEEETPEADLDDAAKALVAAHPDDLAFDENTGVYRHFKSTHWQSEPPKSRKLDPLAIDALHATAQLVTSSAKVDGVLRFAAPYCARTFTPRPGLVNFASGTLEITSMTVRPHAASDDLLNCLPYAYAPGEYPTIAKFLIETLPDPVAVETIKVHIGLAVLGDQLFHKAILLLGPTRSGKSTALKLANVTVGNRPGGAGAVLFDREIEGMRSRTRWNDRPLVTIEELPAEALREEETVKQMIAHDGVPMRGMWQDESTENIWRPKLMFSANEAPRYGDRSGALTTRLLYLSCPNGRPEPTGDGVTDTDAQDLFLKERLMPEVPAFAVACIEAAKSALKTGRYPQSASMRQLRDHIEQRGDALKAWVADYCIFDPLAWTPTARLYGAFSTYCKESGQQALGLNRFMQALHDRCKDLKPSAKRIDIWEGDMKIRKLVRGLTGIRFRTPDDPDPDDPTDDTSTDGESSGVTPSPTSGVTPEAGVTANPSQETANEGSGQSPDCKNGRVVTADAPFVTAVLQQKEGRCNTLPPEETGAPVTGVTPFSTSTYAKEYAQGSAVENNANAHIENSDSGVTPVTDVTPSVKHDHGFCPPWPCTSCKQTGWDLTPAGWECRSCKSPPAYAKRYPLPMATGSP